MRTNLLVCALAAFTLSTALVARAEETGDWYVASMISFIDDDKDRCVDDGLAGLHIGAGKNFDKWTIEGTATYFSFDQQECRKRNDYQIGGGIDLIRRFGNSERAIPYALVGGGYLHTENKDGDNDHGGMLSAAAGILWPVRYRNISLRSELRVRKDYGPGDTLTDWMLSFGLQLPFGKHEDPDPNFRRDVIDSTKSDVFGIEDPPRPIPPEAMTEEERRLPSDEQDSDGDGVPDSADMCGGTSPGAEVDKFGCATRTGSDRVNEDQVGT
jgi:OOP family OmpA-OmpF porin